MWLQMLLNGLWQAALLSVLAAGFSVFFGLARAYNFMVAVAFVVGGYAAYVSGIWGVHPLASFAIAAGLGAFPFAVSELVLFGPFRRQHRSTTAELVISLGLYLVLVNCLALIFGNDLRIPIHGPRPTVIVLGGILTFFQTYCILGLALLLAVILVWIYCTRQGLLIRAIPDNPILAKALGLPVRKLSLLCAIAAGSTAGLVGGIGCWDVGVTPEAGMRPFLLAVVASIIGGRAGIAGAVLGSIVLSLTTSLAVGVLPGTWSESIAFGLLLLVLLRQPQGLFQKTMRGE